MLTQRLGSTTQKSPEFIDSLIEEIKAHPGCCDEVWFATDYGFPPLEKHAESAAMLAESAEKFRKAGIRVSLQLSNSIGHGQYMRSRDCRGLVYPGSPVGRMRDADGTYADYCFCWNDPFFREYTFSALRLYLRAVKPYCVWVDDDLRATNHDPVHFGCFCDNCVETFKKKYGYYYLDRISLARAVNGDPEIRKDHIDFLRSSLGDFTRCLGEVIHEELPKCRMGLQGCANGGYTGYGYEFLYDAMKQSTGFDPGSRPGGGAYSDYSPVDFIDKSSFIAYQNLMLPDYVTDKRPEIENLPDVVFGKSIAGTCFETSCYLASGNTAASYAMLMNDYEPMSWHGEMLGAFAAHRKYWEKLSDVSKRGHASGLTPFFPKTAYLAGVSENFGYSAEERLFAESLRMCAVPVAYTNEKAAVYIINGKIAETLNENEIAFLLSENVVCDGAAVEVLARRGYLSNISAEKISVQELRERFTSHTVNRGFENRTWGGQIWRKTDFLIKGEELETVSEYYSAASGNIEIKGIASAVFTTPAGAKWAVFGFDLWERTKSTEKRSQLLNVCEYLCGSRFTAELLTPLQSCIYPVCDKNGKCIAVSLINCTVGESGTLKLYLRDPVSESFVFEGQYVENCRPEYKKISDNEYELTLPSVPAWSVATLFCK